jgi:hypothetical protein
LWTHVPLRLEHFPAKWESVRRRKCDHLRRTGANSDSTNRSEFALAPRLLMKQRRQQVSSDAEAPGEKLAALPQPFLIDAVPHPVG